MSVYDRLSAVASHILRDVLPSLLMKNIHRPTLYRIQWILARVVMGERVTANLLAEQLEVSIRTITRDIDYLINSLHVPLSYDYFKRSYILSGPIPILFSLPAGMGDPEPAGPATNIIIEIDRSIVRHFSNLTLHPSQRVVRKQSGEHHIHLVLPVNDMLAQWVLSFGGKVRVLEPQTLKDRVHVIAQGIAEEH